ncbi:hypothetical protein [Lacticaseibacillus saniviri]
MDQYTNSNNHQESKPKPTPTPTPTPTPNKNTGVMAYLDIIGPAIMIIAMFLGAFYKDAGGRFAAHNVYPGYKLIFNSSYLMGTLLILCPAIALLAGYIKGLKPYENLVRVVMPVITIIFVFVLKGQIGDELASDGAGTVSFALGGLIYLLGNLISLVVSGSAMLGFDLRGKITQLTKR